MSNNPFPIPFLEPRFDSYAALNFFLSPETDTVWQNQTKFDQVWPNLTKCDQIWPSVTKIDLATDSKYWNIYGKASLYSGKTQSSLSDGESIIGSSSSSIG